MRGLKDKIVIVAGAARGNIGGATATRLADEGAVVVAADLSEAGASSVAEDIRAAGGRAIGRAFDITDEHSYAELIESTAKEYGALHGLFNVAADLSSKAVGRDTDVLSVPLEIWRHTFDATLTGDIASVVAFSLSDDAIYINGQTLLVDAGANFT